MFVRSFKARFFRNCERADLLFHPRANSIFGDNAQGKTSLLEALYFLALGRSFRTHRISELLMRGKEGLLLEASVRTDCNEERIKTFFNASDRKIWVNRRLCRTVSEMIGLFPAVIISPDDELIKGAPQERRTFLDFHLSQIDPGYFACLCRYLRALKQRNCLLKNGGEKTLESWEEQMSTAAAYIANRRALFVKELHEEGKKAYRSFAEEGEGFEIEYMAPFKGGEEPGALKALYQTLYRENRGKEREAGRSLYGPHRDELLFTLGPSSIRSYGSQGQKKTGAIALRFASWALLNRYTGKKPLLFIDDLGDCLDKGRRERILNCAAELGGQLFFTSTEPVQWGRDAALFSVEGGEILPRNSG